MARPRETRVRSLRLSVVFRGRTVAEHRFDTGRPVTIGEAGDVDVVLPGLPRASAVLVADDVLQAVEGLDPIEADDGWARIRVRTHPDVELALRWEAAPAAPRSYRSLLPGRELAYGVASMACLAALLFVGEAVGAVRVGGPGNEPGEIERIMLTHSAHFSAPAVPTARIVVPEPDDQERLVADEPTREGPHRLPEHKTSDARHQTLSDEPAAAHRPLHDGVRGVWPGGIHSHDAAGEVDASPGSGLAATETIVCDDPTAVSKKRVDVVFVIDVST